MKWIFKVLIVTVFVALSASQPEESSEFPELVGEVDLSDIPENELAPIKGDAKAGFGSLLGTLLTAPFVIGQNIINTVGGGLIATTSFVNSTHNALYHKNNQTIHAAANLVGAIADAQIELLTNKTNSIIDFLDTKKVIVANISEAFIQGVQDLVNSSITLVAANIDNHISLAQAIINATLQAKVDIIEGHANATQTILVAFSSLLEQKLIQKQMFLGNISILIQNITDAKVEFLQAKINETLFIASAINNKTIIIGDAFESLIESLLDVSNDSAVNFVAQTTLLLDTLSDVLVTTKNNTAQFLANKTDTLLDSFGDVLSVLANSSVVVHETFVDKFNSSVSSFVDGLVDVTESLSLFQANLTDSFSDKVDSLLENKAVLHSNVSDLLVQLHNNASELFTVKLSNLTDKVLDLKNRILGHQISARSNSEKALLNDLEGLVSSFTNKVTNYLNTTKEALDSTISKVQQQYNSVLDSINSIKANFTARLGNLTCARQYIPDFLDFVAEVPENHVSCSMKSLTDKMQKLTDNIKEISDNMEASYNLGFKEYDQCVSQGIDRNTCLTNLIESVTEANKNSNQLLASVTVESIIQQLDISPCIEFTIVEATETYSGIVSKISECSNKKRSLYDENIIF